MTSEELTDRLVAIPIADRPLDSLTKALGLVFDALADILDRLERLER
jgi:hypothetical protein